MVYSLLISWRREVICLTARMGELEYSCHSIALTFVPANAKLFLIGSVYRGNQYNRTSQ